MAILDALPAIAAFITASATLIYVWYSLGMLKELKRQTEHISRSASFDAVQRVMDMLEAYRSERHEVYKLPPDFHAWSVEQTEAAEK